jgi:predicted kinase
MLVVIGGFAGSGKTTISRRLAHDHRWPRLESDVFGKTVRSLDLFTGDGEEAYKVGYAMLWRLCEDFLASGVSVIVDANMAYDVAWASVEGLRMRHPGAHFVPVLLQCPREVCLERIRCRYVDEPGQHGDPSRFSDAHATILWQYVSRLDRPDVLRVDANRPLDDVYADVKRYVEARLQT